MRIQRGFVLPVVIVFLAVLLAGGGVYYYTKARQVKEDQDSKKAIEDSVLATRAKSLAPATNLEEAKANVETSASILKRLLERSKTEQTLISTLESQYKNVSDLIAKTNGLFNDPSGEPRIIVANAPLDINEKRTKINALLQSWNANLTTIKTLSKSNPSSVTLASLVAKAKEDISLINSFISELETTVNNLTILNSNLSQSEIDQQKELIENLQNEAEKAVDVIESVEIVSKSIEEPASSENTTTQNSSSNTTNADTSNTTNTTNNSSSDTTNNTNNSTNTTSLNTTENTPPPSTAPIVTETDITEAENALEEAEEVLEQFEEAEDTNSSSGNTNNSSSGGSGNSSEEFDGDIWDTGVSEGPELVEGINPISP